jgi:hypothetical protein
MQKVLSCTATLKVILNGQVTQMLKKLPKSGVTKRPPLSWLSTALNIAIIRYDCNQVFLYNKDIKNQHSLY